MIQGKELRLLVVHDRRESCELLKEAVDLNRHNFRIDCQFTTSGEKGLEMVKQWQPAVVLLDAHIGDLNSFKFLDQCKDGAASIIMTSDAGSIDIELSAQRHGARGYWQWVDDPEGVEMILQQIMSIAEMPEYIH